MKLPPPGRHHPRGPEVVRRVSLGSRLLCPPSVDPRMPSGVCAGQTRRRRISREGRIEKTEEKKEKNQKKKKQKRKKKQKKEEKKNYSGGLSIREPNCVSDTVAFFFPVSFLRAVPTVSLLTGSRDLHLFDKHRNRNAICPVFRWRLRPQPNRHQKAQRTNSLGSAHRLPDPRRAPQVPALRPRQRNSPSSPLHLGRRYLPPRKQTKTKMRKNGKQKQTQT